MLLHRCSNTEVACTRGLRNPPPKRPYAPRLPPDERRDQILSAALDLAIERGLHAITIDGVARACGVTRPVVYGSFADRTALLSALMDRAEEHALTGLAAVFPDVPAEGEAIDPNELLIAGVDAYLRAVAADPRTWRVILLPPEGAAEMAARTNAQRRVLLRHLRGLSDWCRPVRARRLHPGRGRRWLLLADPGRWPVEHFTDFYRSVLVAMRPGAPPGQHPA